MGVLETAGPGGVVEEAALKKEERDKSEREEGVEKKDRKYEEKGGRGEEDEEEETDLDLFSRLYGENEKKQEAFTDVAENSNKDKASSYIFILGHRKQTGY